MTNIFHELLDNDNSQKAQLLVCLATTLIENIMPDSTIDMQFDDDQCKTPNERYWEIFRKRKAESWSDLLIIRNLALIRRLDEQPFVWVLLEILATGLFKDENGREMNGII